MGSRPSSDTVAKIAFLFSVILFAFLYGWAVRDFGLFPNEHVETTVHDQMLPIKRAVWDEDHVGTQTRVYDRAGARILDSTAVQPGLTLVPSLWKDFGWKPGLKLIDENGTVLHEWKVNPARIFPSKFVSWLAGVMEFSHPMGSYLFPNGDVLVIIGAVGTARLDPCGRTKWRIRGNHHHSVARAEDGTFWISGRELDRKPDPLTGKESVLHDQLVHLSPEGEIIEKIKIFKVVRNNKALLRRHLRFQPRDTHLNDVEPLPTSVADEYPLFDAGDLLVSLKWLNVVFVVDPTTLNVKWWAGEPFIRQHDPDFMGEGWIGVFDNRKDGTDRGTRFGGSRIVALQPHTDSTAVWFEPSEEGVRLYSPIQGNLQMLENGNLLLTESTAGRVIEVTRDGRLVWEWIQPSYNGTRVPVVYWAERYNLSREEVSPWPCSPEVGQNVEVGQAP